MRILVDILHPAHVHFFRHFIDVMRERGHEIVVTARDKDGSTRLLDLHGLVYTLLSRQARGPAGLAVELVARTARLAHVARAFKPDVMTGIMGPSIALAGRALGVPAVVYYDTEFAWQTNWFVYPLAFAVCTPDCYTGRVRGRHVTYPGYHELAYLHPARFTPNAATLAAFGLAPEEPYSIVRFVSWEASHDIAEHGLSLDQKRDLVAQLAHDGRVLISSEAPLPTDLERFRLRGPYHEIHHLIAFARVLVGESATMASEAAVLGVPAVFVAKTGRGYTDDQETRYGLVRNVRHGEYEKVFAVVAAAMAKAPEHYRRARVALLQDKVDVTARMVDDFERWFPRGTRHPG